MGTISYELDEQRFTFEADDSLVEAWGLRELFLSAPNLVYLHTQIKRNMDRIAGQVYDCDDQPFDRTVSLDERRAHMAGLVEDATRHDRRMLEGVRAELERYHGFLADEQRCERIAEHVVGLWLAVDYALTAAREKHRDDNRIAELKAKAAWLRELRAMCAGTALWDRIHARRDELERRAAQAIADTVTDSLGDLAT